MNYANPEKIEFLFGQIINHNRDLHQRRWASVANFAQCKTSIPQTELHINCWVPWSTFYFLIFIQNSRKKTLDCIEGLTFVVGNHFNKLENHFEIIFFPVIDNAVYARKGRNRLKVFYCHWQQPTTNFYRIILQLQCQLRSFICDFIATLIFTLQLLNVFRLLFEGVFFYLSNFFFYSDSRFI